jgi:hypothetical protein
LKACQGRDVKEKIAESAQDYNGKGVLFQPHHPRTILRGGAMQQHKTAAAAASASAALSLFCHSGRNECPSSFEAQPTPSTKSVQAPNGNSSSVNDMFKVVTTMFQQIMIAQWGRVRRRQNNEHHKNCIKTHEENGR